MAESLSFENLKGEYGEILGIIHQGTDEVKSLNKENEGIEAGPAKARAEYDACIDAGDRKAADKALDKIAAARKRLSNMPDRYVDLRAMVPTLYERQQELCSNSCELRKEKEENLKAMEKDVGSIGQLSELASALKYNIDKLAKLVPPKKG